MWQRSFLAERAMRAQILAVLEELCRDLTLHDVREWYVDAMPEPVPGNRRRPRSS